MSLLEAIILGVVQGFTEFLPISSTAHLRIVPELLRLVDGRHPWNDPGAAATAVIQLGTLGAVLIYFRRDVLELTLAFLQGLASGHPWKTPSSRLAWQIGLGTVPIGVFGLLFDQFIETKARSLWIMAFSLIGLALLMWLAEIVSSKRRRIEDLGFLDVQLIGLAQAVALIPGSSRSGTTITGGLFLGLTREAAARFSFLLSIPAIAASGLYEFFKIRHELSGGMGLSVLVATVVAGASGYLAIEALLRYLRTHSTNIFVVYRLLLGALLIYFLVSGRVT
ncbi:MAG: undecaprenyl-diphosphatase UppP [Acidobacteria bacterium]|nr:undecaprenyl-diphosphatase UppP [Acidobacteriota bacterium]